MIKMYDVVTVRTAETVYSMERCNNDVLHGYTEGKRDVDANLFVLMLG